MSDDELAYRVAFTLIRIPVTAVFAMLVALLQFAMMREVRLPARRWIVAAGIGACIATLIWLPFTLVLLQVFAGNALAIQVRVAGAVLLGGLVAFLQRRAVREEVWLPRRFVVASVAAAIAGVLFQIGIST